MMNKKLFFIQKALKSLPTDISETILNMVKELEGTFISNILCNIYYDKVAKNTVIFKRLCLYSTYLSNVYDDIAIFLIFVKNNLVYSYIIDTVLWMDKLIAIHTFYMHRCDVIKKNCVEILEKIVSKSTQIKSSY